MSENLYKEAWDYALEELKNEYIKNGKETEFVFNFNINYVGDDGHTITASVNSPFMKNQVTKRGSLEIIQNKIREITGQNSISLECIVSSSEKIDEPAPVVNTNIELEKENINYESVEEVKPVQKKVKKSHPDLNDMYTFDTFIPGDNSMYAYNAALAVSKEPGKENNPILFYGGSGLGKTHLMQSIGNYIYNQNSKLKICYISAEDFTNEFTDSIRNKKTQEFKNKYRNLDVLLLDDIHFLENKIQTQEELFYTFNALFTKKAQMVFTCDRPIKETKNMADRLVSRLSNGLTIDISTPDYETRCAILQKKLELKGKNIDREIVEYIAKNIETNVRELEGALNKIVGFADLTNKPLTLEVAKNQLRDIITSNSAENISLDTIAKVIADNYQISVPDLKGKKRDKKFVVPRQIAIYIARQLTEMSYMELGNEFNKDHSTIMHAYEKIEDQIKVDPSLDSKIQLFIREIKDFKR